MLALAILGGVVIGLSLGALGGGGSILTVPVLVYALGQPPQEATTASLIIVGITAITATVGHARAGRVQWRAAGIFGVLGVAASVGGSAVNRLVNPQVLLLAFAALMIVAALAMFARTRSDSSAAPGEHEDGRRPRGLRAASRIVITALVVGFLTGFLGVGGGFLIVPALVLAMGFTMPVAVGTSLVVISITSLGAFIERLGSGAVPWAVVVPFTLAAIAGSLAGKRVADRISGTSLTRAFAALLVAVAGYVAIRAGLAV
ncbi:sulfite exporter TauE/SafE family protein [Dermatophilaceae bacterium Soc4.6]